MLDEHFKVLQDIELSRSEFRLEPGQDSLALGTKAKRLYRMLAQRGPLQKAAADVLVADCGGLIVLEELARLRLVQQTPCGLLAVPRGQVIDELLTEQALLLRNAMEAVLSRQRQVRAVIDVGD